MAVFAVKPSDSDLIKMIYTTSVEEARRRMAEYFAADPNIGLYRVRTQADGDILLKRLRPRAGSVRTETRVVDADFEDNS